MADDARPRLGTRECLNGIRAVAVIGVIGFHLELPGFGGGFLGVDLFFVLSGFLITSLLLWEFRQRGHVALGAFWKRRARRLLPAMLVCVGVVLAISHWLVAPEKRHELAQDAVGALTYTSNWVRAARTDSYFERFAEKSPLEHFWSLAIEEQFYLVWPIALAFIMKRASERRGTMSDKRRYGQPVLVVSGVAALVSATIMFVSYRAGGRLSAIYFRTDTRLQSVLVGAAGAGAVALIGAIKDDRAKRRLANAGLVSGAVAVLAMLFRPPDAVLYQGGTLFFALCSVLAVGSAMLLRGSTLDRFLSWPHFRVAGEISYSLYLWHWPVILAVNKLTTNIGLRALIAVPITVALATASARLIEIPFRSGRFGFQQGSGLEIGAIVAAMALVATFIPWAASGAQDSLTERYSAAERARVASQTPTTRVAVAGDAYAEAFAQGWPDDSPDTTATRLVASLALPQCVDTEPCPTFGAQTVKAIERADADVLVVASRTWMPFLDPKLNGGIDISATQEGIKESLNTYFDEVEPYVDTVLFVTPPDYLSDTAVSARVSRAAIAGVLPTRDKVIQLNAEELTCGNAPCYEMQDVAQTSIPLPAGLSETVQHQARDSAINAALGLSPSSDAVRALLLGDSVTWSLGDGWYGGSPTPTPDAEIIDLNEGRFFCHIDDLPLRTPKDEVMEEPSSCPDWRKRWPALAASGGADVIVFLTSVWTLYDRQIDGTWYRWGSDTYQARLRALHEEFLDVMTATGIPVMVLGVAPPIALDPQYNVQDRARAQNEMVKSIAEARGPNVAYYDLSEIMCDGSDCNLKVNGQYYRGDGLHFSRTGAGAVADWIRPKLLELIEANTQPGA